MKYTGDNYMKYNLWKQIIAWAKIITDLTDHEIKFVPENPSYKIVHDNYEDLMF